MRQYHSILYSFNAVVHFWKMVSEARLFAVFSQFLTHQIAPCLKLCHAVSFVGNRYHTTGCCYLAVSFSRWEEKWLSVCVVNTYCSEVLSECAHYLQTEFTQTFMVKKRRWRKNSLWISTQHVLDPAADSIWLLHTDWLSSFVNFQGTVSTDAFHVGLNERQRVHRSYFTSPDFFSLSGHLHLVVLCFLVHF